MSKIGRNEPCPCGSGEKYKRCCEGKEVARKDRFSQILMIVVLVVIVAAAAAIFLGAGSDGGSGASGQRVWDPEHGHYHDG